MLELIIAQIHKFIEKYRLEKKRIIQKIGCIKPFC